VVRSLRVQVGGAGASRALYGLRQAAEREARRRLLADLSDPNLLLEAQCNSGMRPLPLAAQVNPPPPPPAYLTRFQAPTSPYLIPLRNMAA
jgi:hypothetical protein